jgi:hypothetical protein
MLKFIFNLIAWAMAAASAGTLAYALHDVKSAAIKSHRHGLMNLSKWNQKLQNSK